METRVQIISDRTEKEPDRRSKLEVFLKKVGKRPVRHYTTPHELALEVTTSFVSLIRKRPAEGYVRSSEAVDYKRYAALLEKNNALKEQLQALQSIEVTLFKGHDKRLQLNVELGPAYKIRTIQLTPTLGKVFRAVGEAILQGVTTYEVLGDAANRIAKDGAEAQVGDTEIRGFDDAGRRVIRHQLQLYNLVEISSEMRTWTDFSSGRREITRTVDVWRLTDYGRRQLRAITGD